MSEVEEPRREFIFATYSKARNSDVDDVLVVKEHLHYKDGRIEPNVRMLPNYKRKFYITKEEFRDHEQKKEYEELYKLEEFECTQAEMPAKIARLLGIFGRTDMRAVTPSPYLYGTDVSTPVLLGADYRKIEPELNSDATLAVMDYETDVLKGTGLIVSGSVTFKEKAVIAVTKDFLKMKIDDINEIKEYEKRINGAVDKYIGDYVKERNISLEICIVNNAAEVVIELFKRVHKWMPDFLGFWNMSFDVNKLIEALEKFGHDPAAILSDPNLPYPYHRCWWQEDAKIKTTADGKQTSKHPADLWHTLHIPASFYCVDLMCLFKRNRVREQQRNSYSLDAILGSELNIGKLNFEEADGLAKLEWHEFMQECYPVEYLVYNMFDCISVELLDEKTKDVARSLRPMADISEISKAASNPKRLADNFHFILLEDNKVICSTSPDMTESFDSHTPNKKGWIITLPAELEDGIGRKLINEYPQMETNITVHAADIDVKSAYPTSGSIMNVSKGTSLIEACAMDGVSEHDRRSIGINLTAAKINALEIAKLAYNFPTPDQLLEAFMAQ